MIIYNKNCPFIHVFPNPIQHILRKLRLCIS